MLDLVQNKILEFINELDDKNSNEIYSKLTHGKMLRSRLILKIASSSDQAIELCAIVELIHLASLLHDDVIDNATIRRGVKSINALYGEHSAIMFGDILYSKAFTKLTALNPKISYAISNAVTKLSLGEMLDVRLSKSLNIDFDLYYDMIYKKTSSLIEACAYSAAILVDKEPVKFAIYGKNLGIAFQIVDDILDITQDEQTLGKPAMSDLKEGKITLPYLYYYQDSDDNAKEYLKSLFKVELDSTQKVELKDAIIKSGAIIKTTQKVSELISESLEAIKDENMPELEEIVVAMTKRAF